MQQSAQRDCCAIVPSGKELQPSVVNGFKSPPSTVEGSNKKKKRTRPSLRKQQREKAPGLQVRSILIVVTASPHFSYDYQVTNSKPMAFLTELFENDQLRPLTPGRLSRRLVRVRPRAFLTTPASSRRALFARSLRAPWPRPPATGPSSATPRSASAIQSCRTETK